MGPYGAQRRLQHAPPHDGAPASADVAPWSHSIPSTWEQFAAPEPTWLHVPKPAFVALQMPPQQSAPDWHASPFWPQKLDTAQTPPAHRPEQQSPSTPHALPRVLHWPLRAMHEPPAHVPLQQSPSTAHDAPSDVHAGKLHAPAVHRFEQQSDPLAHTEPSAAHVPPSPNGLPPPELVLVLVLVFVLVVVFVDVPPPTWEPVADVGEPAPVCAPVVCPSHRTRRRPRGRP